MASPKQTITFSRKNLIIFGIILLLFIVVLPQLSSFNRSLYLLKQLRVSYVLIGFIATMATYAAAAGTYYFLAFRPLAYFRTVIVQLAAMFVNRLLPAGLGAFGANYAYLRHAKQSPVQAATMVSVNSLLGLGGHLLVVIFTVGLFHTKLPPINTPHVNPAVLLVVAIGVAVLFVVLLLAKKFRRHVLRSAARVRVQMLSYRRDPKRLLAALSSSVLLTVCNIVGLLACLVAVGGSLPFVAVLIVFTFGIGAGAATPTPGGLGGIEAGLVAGFIAYGVPQTTALATVILYRLISYWLTLMIGAIAFVYCTRRQYFG